MALVFAPSSNRAVVERLSHLPAASGRNGPLRAMEVEASRLPLEIEKTDQPPALALEIAYQCLVFDIEHAQGKHLAPVCRQALDFDISCGTIRKIVREDQLSRRELLEIA